MTDCIHNYEGDRSPNPRCCKCQRLRDSIDPRWRRKAKELLPCEAGWSAWHPKGCPAHYRPAVAKALQGAYNQWPIDHAPVAKIVDLGPAKPRPVVDDVEEQP